MIVPRFLTALASLVLGAMMPAQAHAAADGHWAVSLREQIATLNAVDWRIASGAAALCTSQGGGTGLALDSLAAYPETERDAIGRALGMVPGVVIAAIAPGSPAESAGLAIGDRLLGIAGQPLVAPENGALVAGAAERQLLDLRPGAATMVTVARGDTTKEIAITPVARCRARNLLTVDDDVNAYSDHDNIAITTGLVGFVRNPDELALIAGHELAHIVLEGELAKRGVRNRRKEDAADRLGARIAGCAGYDLTAASEVFARLDSTRILGWLPTLTHRSSKVRQRTIAAMDGPADCDHIDPLAAIAD